MATVTTTSPQDVPHVRGATGLERALGHPLAFMGTALVLLALFGSTFVFNPGRTAPTRDPAFYTWRTEALLTEDPVRLIEIEGPNGLHGGAYRVSAPVIGGLLRRIANVDSRSTIALLMVIAPVVVSLLLAGFAYRHRRDPLLWHRGAHPLCSFERKPGRPEQGGSAAGRAHARVGCCRGDSHGGDLDRGYLGHFG